MSDKKLTRTVTGIFAGVAEGMAKYFGIDPMASRLLWVIALLMTGGTAIIVYIIMSFIVPLEE